MHTPTAAAAHVSATAPTLTTRRAYRASLAADATPARARRIRHRRAAPAHIRALAALTAR